MRHRSCPRVRSAAVSTWARTTTWALAAWMRHAHQPSLRRCARTASRRARRGSRRAMCPCTRSSSRRSRASWARRAPWSSGWALRPTRRSFLCLLILRATARACCCSRTRSTTRRSSRGCAARAPRSCRSRTTTCTTSRPYCAARLTTGRPRGSRGARSSSSSKGSTRWRASFRGCARSWHLRKSTARTCTSTRRTRSAPLGRVDVESRTSSAYRRRMWTS